MPEKWYRDLTFKVHFRVGARDFHYCAIDVWIHGLTGEQAQTIVWVMNLLGDLGRVKFEGATMMGDSPDSERPDLGWEQWTKDDGKVEVRRSESEREYHFYIEGE